MDKSFSKLPISQAFKNWLGFFVCSVTQQLTQVCITITDANSDSTWSLEKTQSHIKNNIHISCRHM